MELQALTIALTVKLKRNPVSESETPSSHENIEFTNMKRNNSNMASDRTPKPPRPRYSPPKAIGSTHKSASRSPSCNLQSKASISPTRGVSVDLSKLETPSLWRYCRNFNLKTSHYPPTREQLIYAVERHLELQQLDEFQVIPEFVYAARRLKSLSLSILN
ncbi:uncharacterized protein LOC143886223 isoform X3 [Tasmannia lanceolata]|uniref:uncharacterized protein LOC143886223 isoform X3 n=1 Tax=Tasmannia lanceolata TaxID=3420 RepID=UPI004062F98F